MMASGLGTRSQHITLMPSDYHQTYYNLESLSIVIVYINLEIKLGVGTYVSLVRGSFINYQMNCHVTGNKVV